MDWEVKLGEQGYLEVVSPQKQPSRILDSLRDLTINTQNASRLEEFRAYNPSAHIHHISPTPLLMTVAEKDVVTPADLALEAFSRAHEPKQLHILPGGHFGGYSGSNFDKNVAVQTEFLRRHLLGDSSD